MQRQIVTAGKRESKAVEARGMEVSIFHVFSYSIEMYEIIYHKIIANGDST